ncbi:oxidoreductase [Amycolatopsis sp. FDAARGOS 1241]|uniref:oxidoreductase n=1 Tax=Amycolatopsis sp. FDAARGOS 1241 TaxID=2778070 RepID=UPI00195075C3|nr:oxidoreductase [Amycolatopsis sp. FDAARGOS 1241]QRP49104.1 oxidoreductase [Amycolatopsis sp. FDAARGOS 1241]
MDDLVAPARDLRSLLTAVAVPGEADRRLTDKAVRALDDAGLFRLGTPRRYGGHEATLRTPVDVGAEADGATGWVVTLVNACAGVVNLFPERRGTRCSARTRSRRSPVRSRPPRGGTRGGRWPYASGIAHADWALLGIPAGETAGPRWRSSPVSDYVVERTWAVAGMRGTGSDTVVAQAVFVPGQRDVRTAAVLERVPVLAPYLTVVLAAPQLGLGRAALRIVREAAATKAVTGTAYARQADSAVFRLRFADAALKVDTVHLHCARAADDVDRASSEGGEMGGLARAR